MARLSLFGVALAVACAVALPVFAGAGEMVRIAVATGQARVALAGPALQFELLADGQQRSPVAGDRAEVALEGDDLVLNGERHDVSGAAFVASGPIRAAGLDLHGEVEVRRGPAGLDVIHSVPLEDYVAAVVEAEMPAAFPIEALRSQAVAARSFALAKKLESVAEGRSWHMGATVLDQVYRAGRDARARAAAEATAGEVLVLDHEPVQAFFHSTCGGRTERGAQALGKDLPYLPSVRCDRCQASPKRRWTVSIPAAELGRLAGLPGAVSAARVAARTDNGRAFRVVLAAGRARVVLGAGDLRQRIGFERLPSLAFEARVAGGEVVFSGGGSGHGAGMCQWGAAGFAREGRDYKWILAKYYPGTEIVRMY